MGLASWSAGLDAKQEPYAVLEQRLGMFFATNLTTGSFNIQATGVTDVRHLELQGDPNETDNERALYREYLATHDKPGASTTNAEEEEKAKDYSTTNAAAIAKEDANEPEEIVDPQDLASAHRQKLPGKIQNMLDKVQNLSNTKLPILTVTPKNGPFSGELTLKSTFVKDCKDQGEAKNADRPLVQLSVWEKTMQDPAYGVVNLIEPEGISCISDIDDTIKDTGILDGTLKVFERTFFESVKVIPGRPQAYQLWYDRGVAFHYVSNAPFALFPMTRHFFETFRFPPGSVHVKFYRGIINSAYDMRENPMRSKFFYIHRILTDFPKRKFILSGDSGEKDPEVYTEIARRFPNQIARIYIHDVSTPHIEGLPKAEQEAKKDSTKYTFFSEDLLDKLYSIAIQDGEPPVEVVDDKNDKNPALKEQSMDLFHRLLGGDETQRVQKKKRESMGKTAAVQESADTKTSTVLTTDAAPGPVSTSNPAPTDAKVSTAAPAPVSQDDGAGDENTWKEDKEAAKALAEEKNAEKLAQKEEKEEVKEEKHEAGEHSWEKDESISPQLTPLEAHQERLKRLQSVLPDPSILFVYREIEEVMPDADKIIIQHRDQ